MNFQEIIKNILTIEPTLTDSGLYSDEIYEKDPIDEEAFYLCLEWLGEQKVIQTINKKCESYSYKHYVEKWAETKLGRHKYISEGAFIAAVIYKSIRYKKFDGYLGIQVAIKRIKRKKNESKIGCYDISFALN